MKEYKYWDFESTKNLCDMIYDKLIVIINKRNTNFEILIRPATLGITFNNLELEKAGKINVNGQVYSNIDAIEDIKLSCEEFEELIEIFNEVKNKRIGIILLENKK